MKLVQWAPYLILISALTGCGGDSGNSPQTEASGTADVPATVPMSASASIGSEGGVVELKNFASLTVPAASPTDNVSYTLSQIDAVDRREEFSGVAGELGIYRSSADSVLIKVSGSITSRNDLKLVVKVSDQLAAQIGDGIVSMIVVDEDNSDDDDKGESQTTLEIIPSEFDALAKTVTASIPSSAFSLIASLSSVEIRLAVLPAGTKTDALSTMRNVHVTAASAYNQCSGDRSFGAPMLFGWHGTADGTATSPSYLPLAGVVGTFGEVAGRKTATGAPGNGHQGIDFFAEEGTPVLAVSDGYIETVRNENWLCKGDIGNEAGSAPIKKRTQFDEPLAEYSATLMLTDGSRVIYRHLSYDSIRANGSLISDPTVKTCFKNTNPTDSRYRLKKGEQIARSGHTGHLKPSGKPLGPHLHFEWIPPEEGEVRNPMCRLLQVARYAGGLPIGMGKYAIPYVGPRLYGNAPLAVTGNVGSTDTEYYVRRKKQTAPVRVCSVLDSAGGCDSAGLGFFTYPLVQPGVGAQWPDDSNGEMALGVLTPTPLPAKISYEEIAIPANDVPMPVDHLTHGPNINVLFPNGTVDSSAPCGLSTSLTWSVSLWWDRGRTARRNLGPPIVIPVKTFDAGLICSLNFPI